MANEPTTTVEWMNQVFVLTDTELSDDIVDLIEQMSTAYGAAELAENKGINRAVLRLMQHCNAKVD